MCVEVSDLTAVVSILPGKRPQYIDGREMTPDGEHHLWWHAEVPRPRRNAQARLDRLKDVPKELLDFREGDRVMASLLGEWWQARVIKAERDIVKVAFISNLDRERDEKFPAADQEEWDYCLRRNGGELIRPLRLVSCTLHIPGLPPRWHASLELLSGKTVCGDWHICSVDSKSGEKSKPICLEGKTPREALDELDRLMAPAEVGVLRAAWNAMAPVARQLLPWISAEEEEMRVRVDDDFSGKYCYVCGNGGVLIECSGRGGANGEGVEEGGGGGGGGGGWSCNFVVHACCEVRGGPGSDLHVFSCWNPYSTVTARTGGCWLPPD